MLKIKNIETVKDHSRQAVQNLGIALMAAATLAGVVEMPDHGNRVNLVAQPSFVFANERSESGSTLRREREETAPHYISYGLAQRTPARSGRV